jgi:hypothetical protein
LAVWNSQRVAFSGIEWVALVAAVGISIWCMAKPLGGPKVELTKPAHLLGTFVSTTSWGLLLIPSLLLVWANLIPLLNRGSEFRVESDGSVTVRRGDSWEPLLEYQYSSAAADGRTIEFTPPTDGPPAVVPHRR